MQSLPSEILHTIARYLNLKEYFTFYRTCKYIASSLPNTPKLFQYPDISVYDFDRFIANACQFGSIKVLTYWLGDLRFTPKIQALYEAIQNEHLEIIELLLNDSRIDPSHNDNYLVGWISSVGHFGIVKLLLNHPRVDPSTCDNYAIRMASWNGHFEVVELLLKDSRVDPSACDNQAIREASGKGHLEVVKLLINDSRVDPSARNNEALRNAREDWHWEVVKLLLNDSRVNPSGCNDKEKIRVATFHDLMDMVKIVNKGFKG